MACEVATRPEKYHPDALVLPFFNRLIQLRRFRITVTSAQLPRCAASFEDCYALFLLMGTSFHLVVHWLSAPDSGSFSVWHCDLYQFDHIQWLARIASSIWLVLLSTYFMLPCTWWHSRFRFARRTSRHQFPAGRSFRVLLHHCVPHRFRMNGAHALLLAAGSPSLLCVVGAFLRMAMRLVRARKPGSLPSFTLPLSVILL